MVDLIYCAGDNARHALLALRQGWHVGLRSDKYAYRVPISFVDCNYRTPDFPRHLEMVRFLRPRYAVVPDLSDRRVSKGDVTRALRQAETLYRYCEVVMIVPKLSGQLALIPPEFAVGYSVPSSYGAAAYPLWELSGRRVHLLGGSPHKQLELYRYLSCIADVLSADANMFQKMSGYGKYWQLGRWVKHPRRGQTPRDQAVTFDCIEWSLGNIRQAWLLEAPAGHSSSASATCQVRRRSCAAGGARG